VSFVLDERKVADATPITGLGSNVCYWESLEALKQLVSHPWHVEAK